MTLKAALTPTIAALLSSDTRKHARRWWFASHRKLLGRPACVEVFLKLDDPYSALLAQVLPMLAERFTVSWRIYLVDALPEDMFPEPDMWHDWSLQDANWLAELYALPRLQQPPEAQCKAWRAYLLSLNEGALDDWASAFSAAWQGQTAPNLKVAAQENDAQILRQNEAFLASQGHYLAATLHFEGEWYWGLDRLDHLEERLNELGRNTQSPKVYFNRTWSSLCSEAPSTKPEYPLVMYFSARSPYSYLGLERAMKLAEHYAMPLEVKPVLPMVMRGMAVPPSKKMYIFLDTKREANKLGLRYGRVADPLGAGVERCYALFNFARGEGKANAYLQSFARRVNAEGVRADTDKGLQQIVEQAGLDWHAAKSHLSDSSWREWAQSNLDEMYALGIWGVPGFRYGDISVWGQDRLWIMEQAIHGRSKPSYA